MLELVLAQQALLDEEPAERPPGDARSFHHPGISAGTPLRSRVPDAAYPSQTCRPLRAGIWSPEEPAFSSQAPQLATCSLVSKRATRRRQRTGTSGGSRPAPI